MAEIKDAKVKYIAVELAHHLPYSIFGVTAGMVVMGMLTFIATVSRVEHLFSHASEELFHIFHSAHVLFSAVATTAMFWKYEKKLVKAISVGFVFSIAVCGISDIFFPFAGGVILGSPMHLHICLIEEPGLVFPFAAIGVLAGLTVTKSFEKSTEYSHSVHVFLSSAASILFLLSFGMEHWTHEISGVFIVTIIAVMIPCCLSDIVLPLSCCGAPEHDHQHNHHHE